MPRIRKILATTQNAIIESNSILRFIKPDLYLTVLDPQPPTSNPPRRLFSIAPTLCCCTPPTPLETLNSSCNSNAPAWKNVSLKPAITRPVFKIHPPDYVTPEVVEFVRARLQSRPATQLSS